MKRTLGFFLPPALALGGLAIVKHIAQLHGGKVTVESESGKGAVFQLTI